MEHKFNSIQTKIELKRNSINDSYQHEMKIVNESFNKENLLEKYSNELNLYRDGLLQQTSKKLRLEIDQVNFGGKQIEDIQFKCGSIKSAKICIGKLIKKEFKLSKKFEIRQLVKYKKYMGLEEFIETVDKSNDINVLIQAARASRFGHLEIVKNLHENGPYVSVKDYYYNTALIIASNKGNFEIVKYLVENGADVNSRNNNKETA